MSDAELGGTVADASLPAHGTIVDAVRPLAA